MHVLITHSLLRLSRVTEALVVLTHLNKIIPSQGLRIKYRGPYYCFMSSLTPAYWLKLGPNLVLSRWSQNWALFRLIPPLSDVQSPQAYSELIEFSPQRQFSLRMACTEKCG